MTTYRVPEQFRGARFDGVDMTGATFREADLTGVRMYGVLLTGADIDGDIRGLRLNGVEVAPLVEAELDRRFPVRVKLRATTPEGLREAWSAVEALWRETAQRVSGWPEEALRRSVNEEWSYLQTLRHLVFVTDAWLGHAVWGTAFHPLGVAAAFMTDASSYGIDDSADPSVAEVLAVRADRVALVRSYLDKVTQEELDLVRAPNHDPGWPPPAARTAVDCLRVVLNEEWAHHQFAIRDLAIIESGGS